jgi:multidrug transporter EmrE-like cation transporter
MMDYVLYGLQVIFFSYVIWTGFGLIIGQKRGFLFFHRSWKRLVLATITAVTGFVGHFFHLIRKKS